MTKRKLAFLTGVLLSLSVILGCKNAAGDSGNGGNSGTAGSYKVTVDFGDYGYAPASLSNSQDQVVTLNVNSSNPYLPDFEPVIKSDYSSMLEFYCFYYVENNHLYLFSLDDAISSDITIYADYRAKPVQNLTVTKGINNTVKFAWDAVPGAKYSFECIASDGSKKEEDDYSYTEFTQTIATDVTSYNFSITTVLDLDDIEESATVSKAINVGVKHSKWLVLMYMDGDNNLNDPIYFDLNEAEAGLAKLGKNDSVTVVALWDGWDFETNNEDGDSSFAVNAPAGISIETASTRLLELGADSRQYDTWGGVQLSPNTLDLTDTVSWTQNGEVNMADEETLENFLGWANDYYTADNVILQFSNHGGGPRSASFAKKEYGRRSMCWDETSGGNGFLKTSDVSKALAAVGYGEGEEKKKLAMIMEDVCLGGSLEEAYELKDYANYYIGSPNNIPGNGFDYISFISSLSGNNDVVKVGCDLVKKYRDNYELSTAAWTKYIKDNGLLGESDLNISITNTDARTLTFVDLSKVAAVKNAVNDLSDLIRNDTEVDERITVGSNDYYYFLEADNKYYDYDKNPLPDNVTLSPVYRWFFLKWKTAYAGDPIYYQGNFGSLKDLGAMCAFMRIYYPESSWSELKEKTNAVTAALANAVVASWRDGYKAPTYYKNKAENVYSDALGGSTDLGAGLTINCACWVTKIDNQGNRYRGEGYNPWYENELAFGKDCTGWTALVKKWWNYKG